MISSPYILIISTIADVATDDVIKRLSARSIAHKRINTEDFPFSRTIAFHFGAEEGVPWMELDSAVLPPPATIWYRRVRAPTKPEAMETGVYEFCLQESRAALLGGIIGCSARWMSHPTAIWGSEYKPFQLSIASQHGLRVPRTVVTNNPAVIRKAFFEFGSMIVKPVKTGYVKYEGEERSIFTSQLLEKHLDELEYATLSPAIYQELIPKKFDIRATIVGREIFAAAIDSQSDPQAVIDWRQTGNPQLPHYPKILPVDVSKCLLALMDRLGLNFGAVDLVETPSGEYVFLEINPNGQWLWIDDKLELGISEAVARWLSAEGERCLS